MAEDNYADIIWAKEKKKEIFSLEQRGLLGDLIAAFQP